MAIIRVVPKMLYTILLEFLTLYHFQDTDHFVIFNEISVMVQLNSYIFVHKK